MGRRGTCVVLLVLAGLLRFVGPARGEEPGVLEDKDYCFRIRGPGPPWRLLPEADARRLVPDALAGLTDLKGTFAVVIAEESPGAKLDDLVVLFQESLGLEEREFGEVEALEFQGHPARRWNGTGTANGVRTRLRHLMFQRQALVFQVVAFSSGSAAARTSDEHLDTLARHLDLTEGTVRPRKVVKVTPDLNGVGWRVRRGVYQSAAHGLEVRPPDGWRLAVGSELATMNDSACVGLIAAAPEVYLVLVMERAHKVDRSPFLEQLRENVTEGGATPLGAPVSHSVGGRAFPMQRYRMAGALPITLHHGARLDDGKAVQVQAWYMSGVESRALPLLRAAYAAVRFLAEPERKALAGELAALPDPENAVGPGHSLRNGVYSDFEHGLVWRKPAGFWTVLTGTAARAVNEDALLSMEAPALGLNALVITEPRGDADARGFHRVIVERLEPKDGIPTPREVQLEGATALVSDLRPGVFSLPFRYVVATVVTGDRAHQLLVWGLEGNMEAARAETETAVRALSLPESLVAQERLEGSFVDHRLGFRLRAPPGAGWRLADITPPAIAGVGTLVGYRKGPAFVMAGAVCVVRGEPDPAFLRDLILETMRTYAPGVEGPKEESDVTYLGRPGKRIVLRTGPPRLVAWLVRREQTFYFFLLSKLPEEGRTEEEEAAALLELLE